MGSGVNTSQWNFALVGVLIFPIFLVVAFVLLGQGVLAWPLLMTFITVLISQKLRGKNSSLWYSAAIISVLMFVVGAVYGMM